VRLADADSRDFGGGSGYHDRGRSWTHTAGGLSGEATASVAGCHGYSSCFGSERHGPSGDDAAVVLPLRVRRGPAGGVRGHSVELTASRERCTPTAASRWASRIRRRTQTAPARAADGGPGTGARRGVRAGGALRDHRRPEPAHGTRIPDPVGLRREAGLLRAYARPRTPYDFRLQLDLLRGRMSVWCRGRGMTGGSCLRRCPADEPVGAVDGALVEQHPGAAGVDDLVVQGEAWPPARRCGPIRARSPGAWSPRVRGSGSRACARSGASLAST